MKIGLVLAKSPSYSETFFVSKIKGLQKKGFEVVLFVGAASNEFDLCKTHVQTKVKGLGIVSTVFKLIFRYLYRFKAINNFIQLEKRDGFVLKSIFKKLLLNQHLFREKGLDWLHFGFATQALGRENVAASINAKMAVSLRGFDIGIYPLKNPGCYTNLWTKIDKLHVISNDLLALAVKNGFSDTLPYKKITPAIDVSLFSNKQNKSNKQKLNFLTVGRLHWKKGYDATLIALNILKNKGIGFTYTIAGSGPEEERIKYTAYDLGLTDMIVFKGTLVQQEIVELYNEASFYIQYSLQEGFCNAVLESQAMGVLPIVSDAEGLSENVLDNKTGWVVKKNAPELLANKILEVLELPEEEIAEMQKRAIHRVQNEFTIEKQQQEFVEFYLK